MHRVWPALVLSAAATSAAPAQDRRLLRPGNTGIPGEEIRFVRFAPDGRVWVGARWPFWREGGIGIYDRATDIWTTFSSAESGSGRGPIPSPFVNDVAFEPGGTAWIATDGGLLRYDGATWTLFNASNTPMAFDRVADVALAPDGHVWINNSDFNRSGDAIWEFDGHAAWRAFRVGRELPWQLPWEDLSHVFVDRRGHVWVANESLLGTAEYNGSSWRFLGLTRYDEIVEDHLGNTWFAPGNAGGGNEVHRFDGLNFERFPAGVDPLCVVADTTGTIYSGNWHGQIFRTTNGGPDWSVWLSGLNQVYDIAPDPAAHDVWVGTIGAVGHFTGTAQWIKDYNTITTGVPDYFVDDLVRGRASGHMYLASMEAGVSRFDGTRWENRGSHNPNHDWPVLADGAMGVYEDRAGDVWIGTNGVARWNPASDRLDLWDWRNSQFGVSNFADFAEDRSGTLFAFEEYGAVYRFDPAAQRWITDPFRLYAVLGIPGAEADSRGNIYFSGWFDVGLWDGASWRVLPLPYYDYLYDLGGVNCIAVAPDDTLWLGTRAGLVHYDGSSWTTYGVADSPLEHASVSGIAFRADGVMAVAASHPTELEQASVSIIRGPISDPASWSIYRYGDTPLPHYQLGRVAFDSRGDLWISCISEAIAVLAVPPAGCPADFNTDGAVDSDDFFDFLNAFNLADPAADFNNDGTVDSDDFFDFLNAFNAGC